MCNKCNPIAAAYRKYGVPKRIINHILINSFHIPEEYSDCLKEYYILKYSGKFFFDNMIDGEFTRKDKSYLVVYNNCTPYAAKRSKLFLSFREAKPEYDLPAYVLVKIDNTKGENQNG